MSTQHPAAKRIPSQRVFHGDAFTDEYQWLADKDDPDTIAFLEAQNAFTQAMTKEQAGLRDAIFAEIKGRTRETDLSVPVRRGGWWYYGRTLEGKQYQVMCRRAVQGPGERPPISDDGSAPDGEEILLDCNELAGGEPFFSLGVYNVSPDGTKLAFSTDYSGNERYTLRFKDLRTGEVSAEEIPNTYYASAWAKDGSAVFYIIADDAWRPYQVWRHTIGTPVAQDEIVYTETDERFFVTVALSRSQRYVLIAATSKMTSEFRLLDASDPAGEFTVVMPRRQGVEYTLDHQLFADGSERLLILHNDGAENFELVTASVGEPSAWTPLIPHRADTRLVDVSAFQNHFVLYYRKNGLTGLRVVKADGTDREVAFSEPVYTVGPGVNHEYTSNLFRMSYSSMITPDSVYDYDTVTGELILLKRRPVLTLPGEPEFRIEDYEQFREWATAPDGTKVPISLVRKKGTPSERNSPLLMHGYGSYEASLDPYFSIPRLSLLDRGFTFAIAHIRGGGEMGRTWYAGGKLLNKKNTFTDYIACARHLVAAGYTSHDRLIARGGSAGGLLMGAIANLAPEAFGGIAAQVPFVDALTTILDPTLPLTVTEWEEWGDPVHDPEVYAYMKSYAPYENVTADRPYPPILAITSLNDTRVRYVEPAKWIAKLQAIGTGGPFLLKTEMIAGHAGRSGRYDSWREEAMVLAWIITTAKSGAAEAEAGVAKASAVGG
ncbi:MAG TPA: S9 family peptidase [Streptosporangiaceae bacterium]|nr:S9 family peptidase [Streptosporangiaceae bacterium]